MGRLKLFFLLMLSVAIYSCSSRDKTAPATVKSPDVIADLQNAVREYPDSMVLVQELIQAYRKADNYDSAIALTRREAAKDTSNSYLWNILATLSYEKGDTAEAIKALQNAIAVFPIPDYYIALGTVYAEMRNKEALNIADLLLDKVSDKHYDDAYFIKGLYYNYTHQPRKAIQVLDSCLSLNFSYMYAYREKAIALYDLKKYQDAVNVLRRAVTLQNNYDEGYYWMGKAYEKLNEKDSAIVSYQNALLYDRNYTEARDALDKLTTENKSFK